MENKTAAQSTEHGFIAGHTAGGGQALHIIPRNGEGWNDFSRTAVCGTAARERWNGIFWIQSGDTVYPSPAEAAAAVTVCRRCAAVAAARMAAATPAAEVSAPAESLEETKMSHPLIEASKAAATRRLQSQFSMSFPALDGGVVMQGHADYCRDHGHATHTREGVVSEFCPRCGDRVAPAAPAEAAAEAPAAPWSGLELLDGAALVAAEAAPDARAAYLAELSAPGAVRVDLDPATAPGAMTRGAYGSGAYAEVLSYWTGTPGRESCIDSVLITVTGGSSHPARAEAAHRALERLAAARVSCVITTGEYQTIATGSPDGATLFIYGTWTN